MNISLESNIKAVLSEFDSLSRVGVPYAIKEAINDTLFELRRAEPGRIESVFDKPVAFTKSASAWEIEKANTQSIVGVLKMKPAQAAYMRFQVYGGVEQPKKKAAPVPEIRGGSQFLASHGGLKKSWKTAFGKDKIYFSGVPRGAKEPIPGIYRRVKRTYWDKKKKKHIGKLRLEVSWEGPMKYKSKWDFYGEANRYFADRFSENFRKRIQSQLDFRAAQAAKSSV